MPNLVLILLGFFLIAALLRVDTYFSLIYLIAAVYILGRLWTRRTMRQLETERRLVNRAFPGEKIPVELRVRNNGWLPAPWVEMHDSLPVEMISPPFYRRVLSLQPHQEKRFQYTLSPYKRGYYLIGPVIWRTGDLLGFLPQLAAQHRPEYIIIYPRVLALDKLGLPTQSPLASLPAPAPLFEDPTRILGVRDYRTGDSPRRIHWTASAAAGKLLVKRYQPAIARETLICLDLDQDNYAFQRMIEAMELAITTAASLANHIIMREGLSVGLATQATDPLQESTVRMSLPPRGERAHLIGILEVLARAQTYRRRPGLDDELLHLDDFLRHESMRLSWGATIVVITGSETDELFDSLVYLRHQGFAVALVLVMPQPPEKGKKARAEALHVPVYRIWREREVEML
ncbi:MAG: DUF58 domain-containing protein [Anaerolineae bacterium]